MATDLILASRVETTEDVIAVLNRSMFSGVQTKADLIVIVATANIKGKKSQKFIK